MQSHFFFINKEEETNQSWWQIAIEIHKEVLIKDLSTVATWLWIRMQKCVAVIQAIFGFGKKISEISHGIGNISYSNGQQKESFGKYQTQIP